MTEGTTIAGGSAGFTNVKAGDSGWTGAALTFPRIQGADIFGRIVATGAGVDARRVGERVLVNELRAHAKEVSIHD